MSRLVKVIVQVADFDHDGPAMTATGQFVVEQGRFNVEAEQVAFMAVDIYGKAIRAGLLIPHAARTVAPTGDPAPKDPLGPVGRAQRKTERGS